MSGWRAHSASLPQSGAPFMLFSKHWLMRRKSLARGAYRSDDPTHHPARGSVPASRWQLWQWSFAATCGRMRSPALAAGS